MHDAPRIEQRVQDILAGSGLPPDRRDEVAEELRLHLGQAVAAHLTAGTSEDEAVASALAALGPPARIRRSLRTSQRRLDSGNAWREVRRLAWVLPLDAVLFSVVPAVVAGIRGTRAFRWPDAMILSVLQMVTIAAFIYGGTMCGLQLKRGICTEDNRFVFRLFRWLFIMAGGLFWLLLMGMVTAAGGVGVRFPGISPWQFCRTFGLVWLHPPTLSIVGGTVLIAGFAIVLTLQERRRWRWFQV